MAVTVLARQMSLSEFGTYGLLVSFTAYLLFVQGSIATAAVKATAEAGDQPARDRAFSTAVSLYVLTGVAAAALIATVGTALLQLFDIPASLEHQAQVSVLAIGVVTAVGWPFKVFQDVLRGSQHFVASAAAEAVGFILIAATLIFLALSSAALWLLVAAGASVTLVTGAVSALVVLFERLPYRFNRHAVTIESLRGFLSLSAYLFVAGIADLVIYSLDRAVLATFRSAATVGLYEAPVRVHNVLQQVHTSLVTPVVPAAARYVAEHDVQRTRELLLRGARYTLAAVVPLTLVVMILATPILKVWLGAKFTTAATAMVVLASYWLLNGGSGVPGRMLIAAGRARAVTIYAASVAAVNLALSLALAPSLGLNGVVLGTTIAYALGFPFFMRLVLSTFPVTLGDFVREVWLPAYVTGAVIAVGLLVVRLTLPLDTVAAVLAAGAVAVGAYWVAYYVVWLSPGERLLVKTVARTALRR
jgi:O-antigen/teichoic acid export membrane protein